MIHELRELAVLCGRCRRRTRRSGSRSRSANRPCVSAPGTTWSPGSSRPTRWSSAGSARSTTTRPSAAGATSGRRDGGHDRNVRARRRSFSTCGVAIGASGPASHCSHQFRDVAGPQNGVDFRRLGRQCSWRRGRQAAWGDFRCRVV